MQKTGARGRGRVDIPVNRVREVYDYGLYLVCISMPSDVSPGARTDSLRLSRDANFYISFSCTATDFSIFSRVFTAGNVGRKSIRC